MSRSVRRVPAHWVHPKDAHEQYIPLHDGADYERRTREWDQEASKWQEGLQRSYTDPTAWVPIEADLQGITYAECAGDRPDPRDYMPQWPATQCTHWQMYEEVTEGTPVSPVCGSPEELARWLADHSANAFAGTTVSYEEWLLLIRQGPTCSGVVTAESVRAGFAS
jgi:hypothetical protein